MNPEHKGKGVEGLLGVLEELVYSRFAIDILYSESSRMLENVDYKLEDVELICPLMADALSNMIDGYASSSASHESISLVKQNMGVFVSAAINRIIEPAKEVRLYFRGAEMDFLGMYLERGKVVVEGNAGCRAGYGMKRGSVLVVAGNAGDEPGHSMSGGDITIRGDAGENVGIYSKDGRIWLHGDYVDVGPACGAKVYHKYVPLDNEVSKAFETCMIDA